MASRASARGKWRGVPSSYARPHAHSAPSLSRRRVCRRRETCMQIVHSEDACGLVCLFACPHITQTCPHAFAPWRSVGPAARRAKPCRRSETCTQPLRCGLGVPWPWAGCWLVFKGGLVRKEPCRRARTACCRGALRAGAWRGRGEERGGTGKERAAGTSGNQGEGREGGMYEGEAQDESEHEAGPHAAAEGREQLY